MANSLHSQCRGRPGFIPGQGTRSHMPQLRVCMQQLKKKKKKKVLCSWKDFILQCDVEEKQVSYKKE